MQKLQTKRGGAAGRQDRGRKICSARSRRDRVRRSLQCRRSVRSRRNRVRRSQQSRHSARSRRDRVRRSRSARPRRPIPRSLQTRGSSPRGDPVQGSLQSSALTSSPNRRLSHRPRGAATIGTRPGATPDGGHGELGQHGLCRQHGSRQLHSLCQSARQLAVAQIRASNRPMVRAPARACRPRKMWCRCIELHMRSTSVSRAFIHARTCCHSRCILDHGLLWPPAEHGPYGR